VIESIYELTSTGGKSEVLMSPNTLWFILTVYFPA
jgi:hypothetical protein